MPGTMSLEKQRQEIAKVTGDADEVTGSTPNWRDVTKALNTRAGSGQLPGYYQYVAELLEQTTDSMAQVAQQIPGSIRASLAHIAGYMAEQEAQGEQGKRQAQQTQQFAQHLFEQVQQASEQFAQAGSR